MPAAIALVLVSSWTSAAEPAWHTGPKFRTALNEPFTAAWKNVELREVLHQIQRQTRVAILLDRRIDPNAMPDVKFTGKPLRQGLADLAEQIGAGISVTENVIYIGPAESSKKLRTLIALREADLPIERIAGRPELRKPRTTRWDDLTEPREILTTLINPQRRPAGPGGGNDILQLAAVEHDLWAAAELPAVSSIAALSLVLIQFDLTFAWQGGGIELVPIPEVVQIERTHTLKGKSPDAAFVAWKKRWPKLKFDRTGRQVKVLATVETHDELAGGPDKGAATPKVSLSRQEFTLKIKDVPARDLMAELEQSGVQFDYDPAALEAAGVDLGQFIELDVENLPAAKFLEEIFGPLKLRAEINGTTVKLSPKR